MHAGQDLTITALQGGRGFINRMRSLGFHVGQTITLVSAGHPGPVMVKIGIDKIAIGHGVAEKIFVS